MGADAGGLTWLGIEKRGTSCLMSSVYLHIKIRLFTGSEGRRFGRRGKIDVTFEENGREVPLPMKCNGLLDAMRSYFRLMIFYLRYNWSVLLDDILRLESETLAGTGEIWLVIGWKMFA